ncbi:MAG: hypothetical protein F9K29_13760 [Hyphomicrobiaceae bacterium]|nr:MAG: hypothetical protein F9K29_13760 [Hyphomicrobiaceae bacterium]
MRSLSWLMDALSTALSILPAGKAGAAMVEAASCEPLPEEDVWTAGGQTYVACAFYTPNYLPIVLNLKQSLVEHGINYCLRRYAGGHSWEAATRLKPGFIVECLERFPDKDVLYLDADAVVRAPLAFLDSVKTDVALWPHPKKKRGQWDLHVTASTLLVRNTPGGRQFARLWRDAAPGSPLATDEDMLHTAFRGFEGMTMTVLPGSYVKIFDQPGKAVIEQFQASRNQFNWRRAINKSRQKALVVAGVLLAAWVIYWAAG